MGQQNHMRWDCEKQGCFNKRMRLKLEQFHDCFPGKINFTDIDAAVEQGGAFIFQEWKSHAGPTPLGQRLLFERLSALSRKIAVFVVCGNAELMECRAYRLVWDGKEGPWVAADFSELKQRICAFRDWALQKAA